MVFYITQNLPACALFTLVIFVYIMQNLPTYCWKMLISFWIKKYWTKVTMIMWDPSSKHFYCFTHFFRMRRVLRQKRCVPQTFFLKELSNINHFTSKSILTKSITTKLILFKINSTKVERNTHLEERRALALQSVMRHAGD